MVARDPSDVDPIEPPPADRQPEPETPEFDGLSPARAELLSVYATLNPRLAEELRQVAPELQLPSVGDSREALRRAARHLRDAGRPPVHRLQLAFAMMDVLHDELRLDRADASLDDLQEVSAALLPEGDQTPDSQNRVLEAMRRAAARRVDDPMRWQTWRSAVGDQQHGELSTIREAWCKSELRGYDDEIISRVETRLVVESDKSLDTLAHAVMPDNWSECNDFFCSVTRSPDRDAGCSPPATGGNLAMDTAQWRGVYDEKVGSCPNGWFPDTFLTFTWYRSDQQLILWYDLGPSTRRTVLRIDQGYIQVDAVGPSTYQVSTVKYLLFDDKFIPNGGQTLGQSAFQLGWLDYSINQFTDCADRLSENETHASGSGTEPASEGALDAELQAILDRCARDIAESASETEAQLDRIVSRLRAGKYRPDDGVADLGRLALRAIRDGARSVRGQTEFATRYVDLVSRFGEPKE